MSEMINEIRERRRVLSDGTEITTRECEVVSANILEVEAGTTGAKGGDSGHGGRTYIRIENMGGTDIAVRALGVDAEGFELELGGDCELYTIIEALKFAVQVLERS